MKGARIHWRPTRPVSWPSGPGRMRTFMLASNIVCHARGEPESTDKVFLVTCGHCIRILNKARFDDKQTTDAVLSRGVLPIPVAKGSGNG